MPIGAFKLNTISAVLASAPPATDAPTIPTVTFSLQATHNNNSFFTPYELATPKNVAYSYSFNFPTATKGTTATNVYVAGYSATGFYPGTVATGTSGQNQVSISSPRSGSASQFVAFIGSPSGVRYRTGIFTGATAASGGTISTSQGRASSTYTGPTITAAHSPYLTTLTTNRPLLAYHTVVSTTNYIAIAVGNQSVASTTITFPIGLTLGTSVVSSSTAEFGDQLDSCGFTSATSSVYKYMIGYKASSSSYNITAFKIITSSVYATSINVFTGATVEFGTVDKIWDDNANNKYVAVSCVGVSGTGIYLRAIRVSWGVEIGAVNPTVVLGSEISLAYYANAQIHSTGRNGLGLLTYHNGSDSAHKARFISVDSSTGVITVGDEITLSGTYTGLKYGVGAGIDATGYLCVGVEQASNTNTARLYKSSATI